MENKKYQTIGTVSKSNRKIVERPKLVLWTQIFPLIKNINKFWKKIELNEKIKDNASSY